MTKCAIKICRNYKGRLRTTKKITFHQIPTDPVMKSSWVDIIRRSRDDFWRPTKSSVVCCEHFKERDFVINKKNRRLKKKTIPSKALFMSSVKSDESENSDVDEILSEKKSSPTIEASAADSISQSAASIHQPEILFMSSVKSDESENSDEDEILSEKKSPATIEDSAAASISQLAASIPQPEAETSAANTNCNEPDDVDISSDLESIFDSPMEEKLRKALRRSTLLAKKHRLKIQCLQRKNQRLVKKVARLNNVIQTLKKKNIVDVVDTDTDSDRKLDD